MTNFVPKWLKIAFFGLFGLWIAASAAAQVVTHNLSKGLIPASFDRARFGCLITNSILDRHSTRDWNQRIRDIESIKNTLLRTSRLVRQARWYEMHYQFFFPRVSLHSVALVHRSEFFTASLGRRLFFDSLISLYQSSPISVIQSLEQSPGGLIKEIERDMARERPKFTEQLDSIDQAVSQVLDRSEPLLRQMVLSQQKFSIIELIQMGLRIYDGDAFTLLGVIGTVLDHERQQFFGRRQLAPISNRILPILEGNSTDHVGSLYHFFSYLNLALVGDTAIPAALSWFYEKMVQKDAVDYSADNLGLILGQNIRFAVANRIQCSSIRD